MASKNKRDTIRFLLDDRGNRLETFDAMANEVTSFYNKFLGIADPLVKDMDSSILQELLNFSFPTEASPSLVKEVSAEEIKNALFNQGNEKAHVPNPCNIKEFRPISCCSVIYKIISKIIVTKLTEYLPDIISLNQTAFIRGRDIIDNSLLAQEIVKGYGRKSISPRCSMKIDLHKAFDSLHWNFLLAIFKGLIFLKNLLTGYKSISLKPNDLLIFCKGNKDSVAGVLSVLHQFYKVPGLHLNPSKCEIFSAGISPREIENFKIIFGFKTGCLPVRYLGIPLVTRKLSLKDCEPLLDKIRQRLHHWSTRNLNYSGRIELIRSVLFSVSNFWCRQLIIPATVLKSVDQLCSRFFWKGANKSAAGARVGWDQICLLKSE
ncbi:uncharacterized protein LOC120216524 [Hibiscus syriacus]|uniref:uncharacterized protein LOC120216524 n=1 Tax=Hibiscus syriacus TaxID=106335 RepID=UPI00192310E6|nr:uncharacterized protein LOC120216524 [Hibiscus syriacus]